MPTKPSLIWPLNFGSQRGSGSDFTAEVVKSGIDKGQKVFHSSTYSTYQAILTDLVIIIQKMYTFFSIFV